MLDEILARLPAYLLIAVRALAMIETAPLLSSEANPRLVRVALAGFAAFCALPLAPAIAPESSTIAFVFQVVGEALIGIIMGFFINLVFAAFSSAGQFFSLQMGFGASETFDPLAQIENPLLGQYLNLIAMFTFLCVGGFRSLFLGGFLRSLESLSVATLIASRGDFLSFFLVGLSRLFSDALLISLPIVGTLFLISVTTGLLSKAAPQMNLLSEGFPISITVAFGMILFIMPFMVEHFAHIMDAGFRQLETLLATVGSGI